LSRFLLPLAGLAAVSLIGLAAGCGGAAITGEPVATTKVTMVKSYRFDPSRIEIKAGDRVTWTNEDNFTHTVQVDGQDDHKVERGESFSIAFDQPGTYHYVCTLHSKDMEGEVIVR
jgi:plastocyanin